MKSLNRCYHHYRYTNNMKLIEKYILLARRSCLILVLLVLPYSTNYRLKSFDFGSGGGSSDSTNYSADTVAGEVGGNQNGTNYNLNAGLVFVQTANVPIAPTFQNTGSWSDQLNFIINTSSNPTDTTYAIAISSDNFVTTNYIQSDDTVGATLGPEDYQTYTAWGSGSGQNVLGLSTNTTYKIKVKARQGKYSESAWGPTASAATISTSLSFDIDVAATDIPTNPPYVVSMGSLTQGSVTTASNKVWVSLDTNGSTGGYIYVYDQYGGLKSTHLNYTITSSSTNLTSASEGFGIQSNTATQTSGGPLAAQSPYNGISENVGLVDSTIRLLYSSSNSPITSGRGSFYIKAKASTTTPSASDYTDTLTVIATASF